MESSEYVTAEPTCSLTIYKMPSDINIGDHLVLQNKPCKIIDIAVCKTGKHGAAKYHFTGLDIFTQKKYNELYMCHQQVEVPVVTRTLWKLLYIEDDWYVHLQNSKDLSTRTDLSLPEDNDFRDKITDLFQSPDKEIYLIIQQAMGIESIVDSKLIV